MSIIKEESLLTSRFSDSNFSQNECLDLTSSCYAKIPKICIKEKKIIEYRLLDIHTGTHKILFV